MTDHRDVVAAFVDNEPVRADELSAALADPSARDYLIDILVLRGVVAGGLQPASRTEPANPRPVQRGIWIAATAATLVIGIGAGFLAGRRTITNEPLVAGPGITATPAPTTSSASAPAPTHVIRMENGVDWNERSGGN